jgi:serine/threonine protein kinase
MNSLPGRMAWKDIMKVAKDVTKALQYLKGQNILHCDIKPANILLKVDEHNHITEVALADFSIAQFSNVDDELDKHIQTLGYRAPEVIMGNVEMFTSALDMYSMGCIMYQMLTNRGSIAYPSETPDSSHGMFEGENEVAFLTLCKIYGLQQMLSVFSKIKYDNKYQELIKTHQVSLKKETLTVPCPHCPGLGSLIKKMLALDIGNRPSPSTVLAELAQLKDTTPKNKRKASNIMHVENVRQTRMRKN